MLEELKRLARHAVPPVVAYLVARGWIPVEAQGAVTDALIVVAGTLPSLVWSWYRDRAK